MKHIRYWSLGIVQWTWWEAVMVRLWATNVVGFASFDEILANKTVLAVNVLAILLIPVWRDIHFYIAHRFLHINAICSFFARVLLWKGE